MRSKRKRTLAGPFPCFVLQAYLVLPPLPPLRPGLPGVPPSSSFERKGLPWFELPGSQNSGPLPTPWFQCFSGVTAPVPQPVTVTSVNVTAAFAKAFPLQAVVEPAIPVMVMATPARMVPWKPDVVIVTAASTHQFTLHASPPSMTTEIGAGHRSPTAVRRTQNREARRRAQVWHLRERCLGEQPQQGSGEILVCKGMNRKIVTA